MHNARVVHLVHSVMDKCVKVTHNVLLLNVMEECALHVIMLFQGNTVEELIALLMGNA